MLLPSLVLTVLLAGIWAESCGPIQHLGGLCIDTDNTDDQFVILTSKGCDKAFCLTANGNLQDQTTGLCLTADGTYNDAMMRFGSCDSATQWELSEFGFKVKSTGNACWHPFGGSADPDPHTKVVIYSGCNEERLTFKIQDDAECGAIYHLGGLCVDKTDDEFAILTSAGCNREFCLTEDGSLQDQSSKLCLTADGSYNNAMMKFGSCDSATQWELTELGFRVGTTDNVCWHPFGGSLYPEPNTNVVVHSGCNKKRVTFKIGENRIPKIGRIQHFGGLCVDIGNSEDNSLAVLTYSCRRTFKWTPDGLIKDLATNKCLTSDGTANDSAIRLGPCGAATHWAPTGVGFRDDSTDYVCWHPFGGSADPERGTQVVVYEGCTGDRLSFKISNRWN